MRTGGRESYGPVPAVPRRAEYRAAMTASRAMDPDNVAPLCRGHHRLKTDGIIEISGKAPDGTLIVERPQKCRDLALV